MLADPVERSSYVVVTTALALSFSSLQDAACVDNWRGVFFFLVHKLQDVITTTPSRPLYYAANLREANLFQVVRQMVLSVVSSPRTC